MNDKRTKNATFNQIELTKCYEERMYKFKPHLFLASFTIIDPLGKFNTKISHIKTSKIEPFG